MQLVKHHVWRTVQTWKLYVVHSNQHPPHASGKCYAAKTELSSCTYPYIYTSVVVNSAQPCHAVAWCEGGWGGGGDGGAHQQPISALVPYDTDREASHMLPPSARPHPSAPPPQSDCQTGLLIGRQDQRQYYKPIKAIGTDCQVMSSTA